MRVLLFFFTVLVSSLSLADRSVFIATPDGKLELINGSSTTVTYSVECADQSNGSNLTSSATSVTLLTKKSISYGAVALCSGGIQPVYKFSQGPFACAGSPATTNHATAVGLCGAGTSLCTFSKLSALGVADIYPSGATINYYWMDNETDPWYTSSDSWSTNSPRTSIDAPYSYGPAMSMRCSTTTSGGVSSCQWMTKSSATGSGAICCPNDNGFKSCKVTIHGTPGSGFLQSPQFKGGTPF